MFVCERVCVLIFLVHNLDQFTLQMYALWQFVFGRGHVLRRVHSSGTRIHRNRLNANVLCKLVALRAPNLQRGNVEHDTDREHDPVAVQRTHSNQDVPFCTLAHSPQCGRLFTLERHARLNRTSMIASTQPLSIHFICAHQFGETCPAE